MRGKGEGEGAVRGRWGQEPGSAEDSELSSLPPSRRAARSGRAGGPGRAAGLERRCA